MTKTDSRPERPSPGGTTPTTARCACVHVVADHRQVSTATATGIRQIRTGCLYCPCPGPR